MSEIDHIYERIRARRAEIERLRLALAQEDSELAVTERNVARFLPNMPPVPVGTIAADIVESIAPRSSRGVRKPKGIPTIFRMACEVLWESTASGRPWLDTHEITAEIKKRWWPGVEAGFVQPQLWRAAAKRNALMKNGARYALPHKNEKTPTVATAGVSQSRDPEVSAYRAISVSSGGAEGIASASPAHQTPA